MESSETRLAALGAAVPDLAAIEPQIPGENRPHSRRLIVAIALMAGITAGLISWITAELAHDVFRPRLVEVPRWEAVWMEPNEQTQFAASLKNAALTDAVLGCAIGLAMGFAGGLAVRVPARGIFAGLSAQAVGLFVGALAAFVAIPVVHSLSPRAFRTVMTDLWMPLAIRASTLAAVGAVGGAAFACGMGLRPRLRAAIGCATAGALLSAICFQLIGASLPLDAGAALPVPRWPIVRLIAALLPSLMIGAGAALGISADGGSSTQSHCAEPAGSRWFFWEA